MAEQAAEQHMDEVVATKHIPVLVAPDKGSRGTPRRGLIGGRYSWMRTVLGSRIKVRLEWRLLMMTHNLTKVHRHQLDIVGA